jgi:hypothetical protein
MTTTTIVIDLDLDAKADSPVGTATAAGCAPRPFHGWLALAAAIEALTQQATNEDRTKEGDLA